MTHTTSTVTRTTLNSLKAENTKLRAQLAELTETVALHEECLEITASALKSLQQKEIKKAPASKKQPAPKKSGAIGRPWSKLTRDEQHRLNAYAWRHPEEIGSFDNWRKLRTTLMFR